VAEVKITIEVDAITLILSVLNLLALSAIPVNDSATGLPEALQLGRMRAMTGRAAKSGHDEAMACHDFYLLDRPRFPAIPRRIAPMSGNLPANSSRIPTRAP
jgi:hypothetical protein